MVLRDPEADASLFNHKRCGLVSGPGLRVDLNTARLVGCVERRRLHNWSESDHTFKVTHCSAKAI
jgi:hypothetical protein